MQQIAYFHGQTAVLLTHGFQSDSLSLEFYFKNDSDKPTIWSFLWPRFKPYG